MADPEHLEIVRQGSKAIRAWRDKHRFKLLDLRGADLRGVKLTRAVLGGEMGVHPDFWNTPHPVMYISTVDFIGADLRGADLRGANLTGAFLTDANLQDADLTGASVKSSYLVRTDLRRAILVGTDLSYCDFTDACLADAICGFSILANANLSSALELASVRHLGPSTVGIDTLWLSGGRIPQEFLRGCGLPDPIIHRLPSLLAGLDPIQFRFFFLSHSWEDLEFGDLLHRRLSEEGLQVWYDRHDMRGGRKSHEQIGRAIRCCDKALFVLSEHSMKSKWVESEIRWVRKREVDENRRVLFPIRLVDFDAIRKWSCFDADLGKDLAVEVREYHIPDFSNWKDHDALEAAFARLMDDLRAESS